MKLRDKLRAAGFVNTWDLLRFFGEKGKDVAISYYPPEPRMVRGQSTNVWSPSFKTDPGSAWYDQGKRTFVGNKSESMPAAEKWASEQYGIQEWAVCPLMPGTRIPAYVRKKAEAFVKKAFEPNVVRETLRSMR